MCLAIPGKIINLTEKRATVEMLGIEREISTALVENLSIGDYVIVHAGSAISKIDEEEAQKTIEIFKELQDIMHE